MWVHAMDVYSVVAKEVEPKKRRLEAMVEHSLTLDPISSSFCRGLSRGFRAGSLGGSLGGGQNTQNTVYIPKVPLLT